MGLHHLFGRSQSETSLHICEHVDAQTWASQVPRGLSQGCMIQTRASFPSFFSFFFSNFKFFVVFVLLLLSVAKKKILVIFENVFVTLKKCHKLYYQYDK